MSSSSSSISPFEPQLLVTRSPSTARLRFTTAYYVLLVALTAVNATRPTSAWLDVVRATAAFGLVTLSALGRIWSSVFVAGRKDSELVTSGPYAVCRHPLYLLSIAGGTGLALATESLVLATATLLALTFVHSRAADLEERALAERFGPEFASYAARVPRWWPRLADWHVPRDLHVHTQVLWKAFVDAGAFLLLYGLVLAARALQASGRITTLIELP
jgi:protein-S-isoprenylcysteine O-methyltransferase Ste14